MCKFPSLVRGLRSHMPHNQKPKTWNKSNIVTNSTNALKTARLLCLWDFPGKHTKVGCHSLFQGIFPTQELNPGPLHYRQILCPWATRKATHPCPSKNFKILNFSKHFKYHISQTSQSLDELEGEVAQLCPTLCDPMDCNLLGFSVHGILQARILEWIAISFSKRSSRPRDRTRVSRIGGRRFNLWATREAPRWT